MSQQGLNEQEIIDRSGNPNLCKAVLSYSKNALVENSIVMTEVQWLSFVSHISGMVYRSTFKEALPPIEKEIFGEVSQDSILLASTICRQLNHLQDDEKYLLSIHFETAKLN
ncbi:hypothetical protein [Sporosarcina sp. FSL K6-3457]|uniref:hypothetical protein n=1 Tax=Sporosarcina sp. FSL K6-3457 TaxID=2978204 RepID=UPI0030F7FEED